MEDVRPEAELADPTTFAARVTPMRGAMLGVARRYLRQEDAEDVVQVAMLRAYSRRWTFAAPPGSDPDIALRSWLLRITYRVFATVSRGDSDTGLRIRTQGAQEISLDPTSERSFEDAGLPELSEEQPDHEYDCAPRYSPRVEAALLALPREFRRVVLLVDAGKTYQQVADETMVPIGTVMSRLYRARAALKASLGLYALLEFGLESGQGAREHDAGSKTPEAKEANPDTVCRVVVIRRRRAF